MVAFASENWPAEQLLQLVVPLPSANVPASQPAQDTDPETGVYDPGEQARQEVWLLSELKYPAAHFVHSVAFITLLKEPAGQATQPPVEFSLLSPGTQGTSSRQKSLCVLGCVLGPQAVHLLAPTSLTVSAGHSVQLSVGLSLYDPGVHDMHCW